MAIVMDMAKEFGYHVSAFHHAVEAYKIGDLLKANGTCAAVWADWWGFKMESYDAISENLPLLENAGACVMIHSDDANGIQRLNQEAAKAIKYGGVPANEAIKFVTLNPAQQLRIEKYVGSIDPGKQADLAIWNGPPLSNFSRCEQTRIEGRK